MRAGIVCDNYKLEAFKKELEKQGFTVEDIKPITKITTVIFVQYSNNTEKEKLRRLCVKLQHQFKRGNN